MWYQRKTFFLLPNSTIDEIDMNDWGLESTTTLARQLNARFFWRRVDWHCDTMEYDWACYKTDTSILTWRGPKFSPLRPLRAPDSAPAEMLCRMLAGRSS